MTDNYEEAKKRIEDAGLEKFGLREYFRTDVMARKNINLLGDTDYMTDTNWRMIFGKDKRRIMMKVPEELIMDGIDLQKYTQRYLERYFYVEKN